MVASTGPSTTGRAPRALSVRGVLVAWAFVPLVFFAMYREGQVDPDLWWHLKAGEWMLQHGRIPHDEFFSYTAAGHEWVAHEWLTEIFFWMLYRAAGMWGLVVLQGLMTAAVLALMYAVIAAICRNTTAAVASTWLVGIACFPFLRVRPHLFTFCLLGIVFALAFFYTQGYRRVVWMFPVLMMLWVNVHAGYVVGLGIGVLLLLYEAVRTLFGRDVPPREAQRRCRELLLAAAAGVFAVLLNPNGARMWIYPFEYIGNSSYTRGILEWKAPDFASGEFAGFELLLLVGFVTLALSQRRPHIPALAFCVALLHQSLTVLRYIPLFALCFGPILGWHMSALPSAGRLRRGTLRPGKSAPLPVAAAVDEEHPAGGGSEPVLLNLALLALLPALFWFVAHAGLAAPAVTDKAYPTAALRQMDALDLQGNLFSDYKWGGFLIFHAYPRRRVFIDGRADAYDGHILDDYLHVSRLNPGWRDILDRYQVQIILWPAEAPLTEALKLDSAWELRYSDPVSVVFSRRLPVAGRTGRRGRG